MGTTIVRSLLLIGLWCPLGGCFAHYRFPVEQTRLLSGFDARKGGPLGDAESHRIHVLSTEGKRQFLFSSWDRVSLLGEKFALTPPANLERIVLEDAVWKITPAGSPETLEIPAERVTGSELTVLSPGRTLALTGAMTTLSAIVLGVAIATIPWQSCPTYSGYGYYCYDSRPSIAAGLAVPLGLAGLVAMIVSLPLDWNNDGVEGPLSGTPPPEEGRESQR